MERVTLNQKEQRRLMVLNQVGEGKLVGWEAAIVLGWSVRQVRRVMAGYRVEGAAALVHGNRGRKPRHALDDRIRQSVAEFASTPYAGFNTQHFTEILAEGRELSSAGRRCAAFYVKGDWRPPERGGRRSIAAAGCVVSRKGGCCRSMAALTDGRGGEDRDPRWGGAL